jgi:hypothetical protein
MHDATTDPGLAADAAPLDATGEILRWIGAVGLAGAPQVRHHCALLGLRVPGDPLLRRLVAAGYLQLVKLPIPFLRYRGVYLPAAQGYALLDPEAGYPRLRGLPIPGYRALILAQEARLHIEQQLAAQGGAILHWQPEPFPPGGRGTTLGGAHVLLRPGPNEDPRVVHVVVHDPASAPPGDLAARAAAYHQEAHPVFWVCLPSRAADLEPYITGYPNIAPLVLTPLIAHGDGEGSP